MDTAGKKADPVILTGPGFKAKLKFYHCRGSGDCIPACPENAIERGPERMPAGICNTTGKYEMLPGKAEINPDKCTGCGKCITVCPNNALEMVAVAVR